LLAIVDTDIVPVSGLSPIGQMTYFIGPHTKLTEIIVVDYVIDGGCSLIAYMILCNQHNDTMAICTKSEATTAG
jgi:hypothetical protein